MKRLNIFVDETGDFGYGKKASRLYGVSFTFHEQEDDIEIELNKLNERLKRIGYSGMIHMADLIMKRGDYKSFDIDQRRKIFKAIFHFSRQIPVKYHTILIDKKYTNNKNMLKQKLNAEIFKMVQEKEKYFKKFDKIVMYYDNGQKSLTNILETIFLKFESLEQHADFNHEEKRLFQISDMLTYIDKYDYKYKNKIEFTNGEQFFFTVDEIKKILRTLNKKRILYH